MKKIFFVLFVFCLSLSCSSQSKKLLIGNLVNDIPVLTVEKAGLLSAYNANLLKASNIDGQFSDVTIQVNGKKEYYLVFTGKKFKSTFSVELTNGELRALSSISCTTSECSAEPLGCVPLSTACSKCGNGGKCTKTITENSLLE